MAAAAAAALVRTLSPAVLAGPAGLAMVSGGLVVVGRADGRVNGRADGRVDGRADGRAEVRRLGRQLGCRCVD